jgi:predicted permease
MCLALGASRARLARGVALEGLLLSIGGVAFSWPVASWIFHVLQAAQLPGGVEVELLELAPDRGTFLVSATAALLATALIALIAGVSGFPADAADGLRSRAGATPRLRRRATRSVLVSGQVAVALVLLAGAGLLTRSLRAALDLNTDVRMSRLLGTTISLDRNTPAPAATAFFENLLGRLRGQPSMQTVASSEWQGGMTSYGTTTIDGVPRKFPSLVSLTSVDPNYFPAVGLRLLRGRDFSPADGAGAPRVVIVSESLGRMMANGGNPLGSRIRGWSNREGQPPDMFQVVGVVSDVITNVNILEPLDLYVPLAQGEPGRSRTVNVRVAGTADEARRDILGAIKSLDPAVMPGPIRTLEERIDGQMRPQRFGAVVLGALGGIAALLTILGTFVMAESMAVLRTREMGIRAALGASRAQLGAIVFGETLRLVGIGLAFGLGLAWLGGSTIRSFLFQVQPLDPVTLATAAAAILIVALLVSLRPALRAARVDLATVLKEQ